MSTIPGIRPRLHIPYVCFRDGKKVDGLLHEFGCGAVDAGGWVHYICKHCGADCVGERRPGYATLLGEPEDPVLPPN